MKVLFNLLDAGIGGGQQVALSVARHLAQRQHEFGVLVPAPGPASIRFEELGAAVHVVDAVSLRRPMGAVHAARVTRDYDVIYSHTSVPGEILAAAAALLARKPHVVHQHIYPDFSVRTRIAAAQRLLFRAAARRSRLVAVAAHVADAMAAAGIPHHRIAIVENGVEIPAEPAPPRIKGPVRIGLLGRLERAKAVDIFVAAVRASALSPEQASFALGGPSVDDSEARTLVVSARDAAVEVTVPCVRGTDFLRKLDIVALPSRYEGHPLVLLEAMALGKAVVASAIPGVREMLAPSEAGLLVPPEDASALAEAFRRLAEDSELRAELGRRARRLAESQYALGPVHERLEQILCESVMTNGRAGVPH
jgi:glycosyltransferase involved in cell wall biosynthesis